MCLLTLLHHTCVVSQQAPAGGILASLQSGVTSASVTVVVHCGICFMGTTALLMTEAALLAFLIVTKQLRMDVSFGIAVAFNFAIVMFLAAGLLIRRKVVARREEQEQRSSGDHHRPQVIRQAAAQQHIQAVAVRLYIAVSSIMLHCNCTYAAGIFG